MAEQGNIKVWLKAINYAGASVGSNTEFDISINGQITPVSTDLNIATTKAFDQILFAQSVEDAQVELSVEVTVTEEDLLFDDVGASGTNLLITKGEPRHALPPLTVAVRENRGVFGSGVTAMFTIELEAEFLATGSVTACCWNGQSDETRTLASYYGQTVRHRRMADYLTGACAYFNLQAAIGYALGAIEDGVSKSKRWIEDASPTANWMQLSPKLIKDEFIKYWELNDGTGVSAPTPDDVCRYDVLNAAAAIWYFVGRSPGEFGDDHISYKTAMYKAMQYNWGPEDFWRPDKEECRTYHWEDGFRPSAYAWTMAFLAWGNGYAVPDIRYTAHYAQYAAPVRIGRLTQMYQEKRLSPLDERCTENAPIPVPEFTVPYTARLTPYGYRSLRQAPRNRQIVILARKTPDNTDHDYISALRVALHIAKTFRGGVAPMVTADTYFACESMKASNTGKAVCVLVLGTEAKNDVEKVYPGARAYSTFTAWAQGSADGFVDVSGTSYRDTYRQAVDQAVTAYNSGY